MSDDNKVGGSKKKGFASLSPERRKEIASQGGKRAHEIGSAHTWTKEEAREAGKKGGDAISKDKNHMSTIGRKGGRANWGKDVK